MMNKNDDDVVPAIPDNMETKKLDGEDSGKLDSGIGEESILERIAQLKLTESSDDPNNNKSVGQGDGEDKDGNSDVENSATANDDKRHELSQEGTKEESCGVLSETEEYTKSKPESPKECHSPQSPGRLSPAEFFQTSRLRSSALANKLNTTHTYGGSADLAHNASSQVDEITKGVERVALEEEKESKDEKSSGEKGDDQTGEEEKSTKSEGDSEKPELIDRSPVSVYGSNRHAHHPYQQQQQQHAKFTPCQV